MPKMTKFVTVRITGTVSYKVNTKSPLNEEILMKNKL